MRARHSLAGLGIAGLAAAAAVTACGPATSSSAPGGATSTPPAAAATHAVAKPAPAKPAPKPAPAKPVVLLGQTGTGTQVTRSFHSASGTYKVVWVYSNNGDQYGPSNFIMSEDGGNDFNALSLPNDIAAHGQGSTEITDDPGTHTFNVQATGTWAVTVVSVP